MAAFFLAFLRNRKNSLLSQQYAAALHAENNGDTDEAIRLYKEALSDGQRSVVGDKLLMNEMERRLKTLQISTEFEQSFRRKIIIPPVSSRPKDQTISKPPHSV
jgi:hypothetical protein